MKAGTPVLYEPAFSHNGVFARPDILTCGKDGWGIYEVKNSTGEKAYYQDDIAIQFYVLKGLGYPVDRAFLVHINNQYVRQRELEPEKLFAVKDLTGVVTDKQPYIQDKIQDLREMLKRGLPETAIGPQCHDPYECDFVGHCWDHLPAYSVFELGGRGANPFDFYNQGILKLEDVPFDRLSPSQQFQLERFLKKDLWIDREKLNHFLASLWYPLAFLDFETLFVPVPLFDGTRPYQPVPFQFSLHVEGKEGGS